VIARIAARSSIVITRRSANVASFSTSASAKRSGSAASSRLNSSGPVKLRPSCVRQRPMAS